MPTLLEGGRPWGRPAELMRFRHAPSPLFMQGVLGRGGRASSRFSELLCSMVPSGAFLLLGVVGRALDSAEALSVTVDALRSLRSLARSLAPWPGGPGA